MWSYAGLYEESLRHVIDLSLTPKAIRNDGSGSDLIP
jgi:hypothetical protein